MAETALKVRSRDWRSMQLTTPTAGYTAGQVVKVEDTVFVIVETKTVGQTAIGIYNVEKIVLPKVTGSGITFAAGDKVYYDGNGKVTNVASGNTLCGRANEAADANATEVEVTLNGDIAA